MKFVSELPPVPKPRSGRDGLLPKTIQLLADLRSNPGVWGEIQRYERGIKGRDAASSRGHQFCKKHEGVEYAIRTMGNETILYMRAVEL